MNSSARVITNQLFVFLPIDPTRRFIHFNRPILKRVLPALLLALPTSQTHAYEINDLVFAHYRFNALFDQKSLSDDETRICADIYEQLKLHFVDGVDWTLFNQLSDENKSSVSQQDYLRFKVWGRGNLELAKQLEEEASQSIEIN